MGDEMKEMTATQHFLTQWGPHEIIFLHFELGFLRISTVSYKLLTKKQNEAMFMRSRRLL